MKYTKQPLSIAKQIQLLEDRGLKIDDKPKAEKYLANISYYRMSAYMYPFKVVKSETQADGKIIEVVTNEFVADVTFDDVLNSYLFDREFRLLIFDAIERLEIAFRTQLIYCVAMTNGAFWFEDVSLFHDSSKLTKHLETLEKEIERSGETFLKQFFIKYDENKTPPVWMSFEIASFGLLSQFYKNLNFSLLTKNEIAKHFGLTDSRIFQNWIESITYIRNICAHHSRLWNRTLVYKPKVVYKVPKLWVNTRNIQNDRIYYSLCCLWYLLREVNPETSFVEKLKALFAKYPNTNQNAMGFPKGWENEAFWQ